MAVRTLRIISQSLQAEVRGHLLNTIQVREYPFRMAKRSHNHTSITRTVYPLSPTLIEQSNNCATVYLAGVRTLYNTIRRHSCNTIQNEFTEIESSGQWQNLFKAIQNQGSDDHYRVARMPWNCELIRYRDFSPYDHSRVKLEGGENDFINASLVKVEEAEMAYIISQGPLRNTCGQFWQMVWEQRSKAVIMLNNVTEKGREACAQYWPTTKEKQAVFTDTQFAVRLVSEEDMSNYTVRVLELQNAKTAECREIYHFHYTAWPDMGVPESPASLLSFLFRVRELASLGPEHAPPVVHCSAGIGRSGTFSLVDACLVLMDKKKDLSSADVQAVLLGMRKYRKGLVQTPEQFRFAYMAVIEGAKSALKDTTQQRENAVQSASSSNTPTVH